MLFIRQRLHLHLSTVQPDHFKSQGCGPVGKTGVLLLWEVVISASGTKVPTQLFPYNLSYQEPMCGEVMDCHTWFHWCTGYLNRAYLCDTLIITLVHPSLSLVLDSQNSSTLQPSHYSTVVNSSEPLSLGFWSRLYHTGISLCPASSSTLSAVWCMPWLPWDGYWCWVDYFLGDSLESSWH